MENYAYNDTVLITDALEKNLDLSTLRKFSSLLLLFSCLLL